MLNRFIKYWIPTNTHDDLEHYRQARLTVVISLVCISSGFFYVPMQYFALMYPLGAALSFLGMIQVAIGLGLLKFGISYRYVGQNIALTYFWLLSTIATTTGGIESSATLQLICVPLVAMILCGKQSGFFWLSLCLFETSIWSVLRISGVVFPVWYPAEYQSMLYITGQPGAIVTIFLLASAFEQSKTLAQEQSEQLLLNILPRSIAERLANGETTIIDSYQYVSVLFADIVEFTNITFDFAPQELVQMLDTVFSSFDVIAQSYHLEKIKTIGDCYMLVGGAPEQHTQHLENIVRAAFEIRAETSRISTNLNIPLKVRIGIHAGPAVAGIIGKSKFNYDLWGDVVNTASRMESHGEAGKIHCTQAVFDQLCHQYAFEERGEIEIKGKGLMKTFFLG